MVNMSPPPNIPGWVLKLRTKNLYVREFLAEFFGTFILIIYGDAAFALTILDGKGVPDVFGVTWAWGIGVLLGIASAGGVSGGHINPAVTVGFAAVGKLPWKKVPVYLAGQHLGGFLASAVLYFTYLDALNLYDPNRTVVGKTATAWAWATYPRDGISIWNCFFGELVAGGLLMFTVLAIVDRRNLNVPKWLWPLYIGFMIQVTAQVFGLNAMAPINPARDFPTRIFTAIAGWGKETFSIRNNGYWWIGLLGPHLGCIIGAWFYMLAIEIHWPEEDSVEEVRKSSAEMVALRSNSKCYPLFVLAVDTIADIVPKTESMLMVRKKFATSKGSVILISANIGALIHIAHQMKGSFTSGQVDVAA